MSKPPKKVASIFNSATARDREITTRAVFFLFRPRLAQAIDAGLTFPEERRRFLLPVTSVYRTASTGDTFPAMRPGRAQDSSTVSRAKTAAKRKIQGDMLMTVYLLS